METLKTTCYYWLILKLFNNYLCPEIKYCQIKFKEDHKTCVIQDFEVVVNYFKGTILVLSLTIHKKKTLNCDSLSLSWVWTRTFPPKTWCAQFLDAPCWGRYQYFLSHFTNFFNDVTPRLSANTNYYIEIQSYKAWSTYCTFNNLFYDHSLGQLRYYSGYSGQLQAVWWKHHCLFHKWFSSLSKYPHRLWNSSSFLFNGHAGLFCQLLNRPKRETGHSPLSSVPLDNVWSYTSIPHYPFTACTRTGLLYLYSCKTAY